MLLSLAPHPELFCTERAHVRMLRVLDLVFFQKLSKEALLPAADIRSIFTNLEEVLQLHGTRAHAHTHTNTHHVLLQNGTNRQADSTHARTHTQRLLVQTPISPSYLKLPV